jgi:hypothetical protein
LENENDFFNCPERIIRIRIRIRIRVRVLVRFAFAFSENLGCPGSFSMSDGRNAFSFDCGMGNQFIFDGFQSPSPSPPPLAIEFRKEMTEKLDLTLDHENHFSSQGSGRRRKKLAMKRNPKIQTIKTFLVWNEK